MNRLAPLLVVLVLCSALAGVAGATPPAKGEGLFSALGEWMPDGELRRFDADGLWQHINGAAEVFLHYGFEELREQDIVLGDYRLVLGLYDMGTALNAFGIYKAENDAVKADAGFGAASQASAPYQWLLVKDRFYVKLEYAVGKVNAEQGEVLLSRIAAALPGDGELPPELDWLPATDRIPGSESVSRGALFGLAELGSCVHARYALGDGEHTVFLLLPEAEQSVNQLWKHLATSWKRMRADRQPILLRQIPYEGMIGVVKKDCGLLGLAGVEDEKALKRRLSSLEPGAKCSSDKR